MSAPTEIDSLQFARSREQRRGSVPVAAFARLSDVLAEPTGSVAYRLSGAVDASGKPELEVEVTAQLALVCQRCLEPFAVALERRTCFALVTCESDLRDPADEREGHETVLATEIDDVADLVEQEVLLALPLAPMHPDAQCSAFTPDAAEHRRSSPFAALAAAPKV
jgi:uncharacterized protein